MADELTANADPTVTLSADAGPFEQALDRATAKLSGWGKSIESKFAKISDAIKSKTGQLTDALGSINEKVEGGMSAAGAIGGRIGATLGARLGPIGSKVGEQLGEGIAEGLADTVDFAAALGGANSLKAAVEAEVDAAKDGWAGFKWSAQKRFEEIRGAFADINLADLMKGDADAAGEKLSEAFGRASDRAELLIGQGMARIGDRINSVFERVREPLAGAMDFLQSVAERFGLIEEGTAKWGDAIRNVQDLADKAFRQMGRAIGWLEALFVRVGASVVKALAEPISKALEIVLKAARNALDAAEAVSPFGNDKLKEWSANLAAAEGRIRDAGAGLLRKRTRRSRCRSKR